MPKDSIDIGGERNARSKGSCDNSEWFVSIYECVADPDKIIDTLIGNAEVTPEQEWNGFWAQTLHEPCCKRNKVLNRQFL